MQASVQRLFQSFTERLDILFSIYVHVTVSRNDIKKQSNTSLYKMNTEIHCRIESMNCNCSPDTAMLKYFMQPCYRVEGLDST